MVLGESVNIKRMMTIRSETFTGEGRVVTEGVLDFIEG